MIDFVEGYIVRYHACRQEITRRTADPAGARDEALLVLVRLLALCFVQATGRLCGDRTLLMTLWQTYRQTAGGDRFGADWLPRLFAACNRRDPGPPASGAVLSQLPALPDLRGSVFGAGDGAKDGFADLPLSDERMADLIAFLAGFTFSPTEDTPADGTAISPAMLGTVYERLVGEAGDGRRTGVFYTGPAEIDLMCRLAVVDSLTAMLGEITRPALYATLFSSPEESAPGGPGIWTAIGQWLERARVLDPACGAGSFLVGMGTVLNELGALASRYAPAVPAQQAPGPRIPRLYGIDVQERAVQIARLRLWLQYVTGRPTGKEEAIPSPQAFHVTIGDSLLDEPFPEPPGFDIVIGNPPYVRQEAIGAPAYKAQLRRALYRRFPAFFGYNAGQDRAARPLDGHSDLYLYFYFLGRHRLAPGGTLCYLTSNAWMDTGYGALLRDFLVRESQVRLVIDHQRERSFAAEINTTITLLRSKAPETGTQTRFVACRAPFGALRRAEVWQAIDEASGALETGDVTVRVVPQADLTDGAGAESTPVGPPRSPHPASRAGWGGTYLRAPDIVLRVLERAQPRLTPLGCLGRVETGIYTGINEFFYLDKARVAAFGIEPEFLMPVIRSPRDLPALHIDPAALDTWLFVCPDDKATLARRGQQGALAYIAWGEGQVTTARQKVPAGVRWPQVPSVARRRPGWWAVRPPAPAHLFLLYGVGARHGQRYCPVPVASDRRLHTLNYAGDAPAQETLAAILNTVLTICCIELRGRTNLGQGVLDFATMDARQLPVLDPAILAAAEQEALRDGLRAVWEAPLPTLLDPAYAQQMAPLNAVLASILRLTPGEMEGLVAAAREMVETRVRKAGRTRRVSCAPGSA